MKTTKTNAINSISVPHNFVPRDYQLALLNALDGVAGKPETKVKRAFLRWHRRAGKDMVCVAYMFKCMMETKGVYYYFLPTYQQGRKVIWENINRSIKILDMLPEAARKRVNNQEMLIETINGSIFRVIGTDNIDTIVGTNPVGVVFSEFSMQDPRAWAFIRPILLENDGWAIFNGTPRGKNHMYRLEISIRNNPNWFYSEQQSLWPDRENYTGAVTPEQIKEERATGMDEDLISQEYGVSYNAGVQGAIYEPLIAECYKEDRVGIFPYNSNYPVFTFWDLGYNDPTAIWFVQYIGSAIIFIDYWEEAKKEIPEIVSVLEAKGYKYSVHYLPHDANQNYQLVTTKAAYLQQCLSSHNMDDIVIAVPKLPIQEGITAARSRFPRFCFNVGTTQDGIDKLMLYHKKYDEKREVYMAEPVHDWTSHAADALRVEAVAREVLDDPLSSRAKPKIISDYDIYD